MSVRVEHGDCLDVMRRLIDEGVRVDSVVTDPPYGLGFMGKAWDSPDTVAFNPSTWGLALALLKPGGHLLAFNGTRTYHRMAVAIEDAGFEIRDQIGWVYGSGFPKSHDISKAIDKIDAAEVRRNRALQFTAWMRSTGITARQINDLTGTVMASHYLTEKEQPAVATRQHLEAMRPLLGLVPAWVEQMVDERTVESENFKARPVLGVHDRPAHAAEWRADYTESSVAPPGMITAPATDAAREWQGWGTALKPAWEPIVLARKPLIGTVAANVLAHRTGGLNVDACRVGTEGGTRGCDAGPSNGILGDGLNGKFGKPVDGLGRWPANIVHDGSPEVLAGFPESVSTGGKGEASLRSAGPHFESYGGAKRGDKLGANAGGLGDSGSAARFFYTAKADAADRLGSKHPTVKPVDLMAWLCRLITPCGGLILDPFAGSGTTGMAAMREGFDAILIEREAEYVADIQRRLAHVRGEDAPLFAGAAA